MTTNLNNKIHDLYTIAGINHPTAPPKSEFSFTLPDYIFPPTSEIYIGNIPLTDISSVMYENIEQMNQELLYTNYNQLILVHKKIQYPQNGKIPYPFYHTCACSALKKALDTDINNKFAISTRYDGSFLVVLRENRKETQEIRPHVLCHYCYKILDSKLNLTKKGYNEHNFDIFRFYKEECHHAFFSPKRFSQLSTMASSGNLTSKYPIAWAQTSLKLKELRNWTCERCNFHATTQKEKTFIEVHHKNKNCLDIRPENLEVLCYICHNQEHPHRPQRKHQFTK